MARPLGGIRTCRAGGDRRSRRSRGQSTVELALALPMLLWLVCGLLDLGRAYYGTITVTDAARHAARTLSTANQAGGGPGRAAGCAAVKAAVVDLASSAACGTSGATPAAGQVVAIVTCPAPGDCGSNSAGSPQMVTVQVSYGFQLLTPLVSSLLPVGTLTLTGRAVMSSTW